MRSARAMQEIMTGESRHLPHRRGSRRRPSTNCRCCSCEAGNIGLRYARAGTNPELVSAYRMQKMLKLALCVAYGALTRTESRGAHFRAGLSASRRRESGFSARWPRGRAIDDTLPTLDYEPLDVDAHGAAAGMARLWRQGLYRPSGHRRACRGGRSREGAARRHGTRRRQQALMPYEASVAGAVSRPQRAHRRTVGRAFRSTSQREARHE